MPETPPVGHARPLRGDDTAAVIALIGGVYAEYPGCVLDLPGVDADLPRLRDAVEEAGGAFWVVERDREVVACAGWAPHPVDGRPGGELKRLYVRADQRGSGLGRWLVERVERAAAEAGAETIELWSDTRFLDAHRLYTRLGYAPTGETRELHDPSDTTEYRFVRDLPPA
ncbi:MAG: GNAT family N-acetyltransferase [Actinobacteria bacterium]|nr:GNAT family N-acetyltransferase [Actinomycetota bacterium]